MFTGGGGLLTGGNPAGAAPLAGVVFCAGREFITAGAACVFVSVDVLEKPVPGAVIAFGGVALPVGDATLAGATGRGGGALPAPTGRGCGPV